MPLTCKPFYRQSNRHWLPKKASQRRASSPQGGPTFYACLPRSTSQRAKAIVRAPRRSANCAAIRFAAVSWGAARSRRSVRVVAAVRPCALELPDARAVLRAERRVARVLPAVAPGVARSVAPGQQPVPAGQGRAPWAALSAGAALRAPHHAAAPGAVLLNAALPSVARAALASARARRLASPS